MSAVVGLSLSPARDPGRGDPRQARDGRSAEQCEAPCSLGRPILSWPLARTHLVPSEPHEHGADEFHERHAGDHRLQT